MVLNHRERLAICSSCINRKLDFEFGYLCQLTGQLADFKVSCKDYVRDETVTENLKVRTEERPFVPLFDPPPVREEIERKKKTVQKKTAKKKSAKKRRYSDAVLKKLRKYQSFLMALIGGLLIVAVSSVGWALITATTGYQGAYMALGTGVLVGITVRYFGAGIYRVFGVLAALLALAGSLLGYYLSQTSFLAESELAGIATIPDYLIPDLMRNTMQDTFVPLDLVFYGLAALMAYFLAIRRISSKKLARLEGDGYAGAPALYWFRLPLLLGCIIIMGFYIYTLTL
jgi:hypothetical protein